MATGYSDNVVNPKPRVFSLADCLCSYAKSVCPT